MAALLGEVFNCDNPGAQAAPRLSNDYSLCANAASAKVRASVTGAGAWLQLGPPGGKHRPSYPARPPDR
jgi:hypothetical protein